MRCLHCNKRIRNKRKDARFCSSAHKQAYHRNRNDSVTDNIPVQDRLILSLCDFSGVWSQPYLDAGYDVVRADIKHGQDVRLLLFPDRPVYGLLAAPPCTNFSKAGNRWRRSEQDMLDALSVVDACLRLAAMTNPVFWALENPVGKLKHYLGTPKWYFNPCDYGDPYTKKTCLWGKFNAPAPGNRVDPLKVPPGHNSIDLFIKNKGQLPGKGRAAKRSVTPKGFAQAFFQANK
jgi:hypothetical protein